MGVDKDEEGILIMRPGGHHVRGLHDLCNFIENTNQKSIIEIGSYTGESTIIFASYFSKVLAVDPWMNGYDSNDPASSSNMSMVEEKFNHRTAAYDNIIKNKMLSHEFANIIPNNSIEVVYIDGDHTYDGVTKDINTWLPKIVKGGYICGHDYYSSVKKAVNNIFNTTPKVFCDSSWVYRR